MVDRSESHRDRPADVAVGLAKRSRLAERIDVVAVGRDRDYSNGYTLSLVRQRTQDDPQSPRIPDHAARTCPSAGLDLLGARRPAGLRTSNLVDMGRRRHDLDRSGFALSTGLPTCTEERLAGCELIPSYFGIR